MNLKMKLHTVKRTVSRKSPEIAFAVGVIGFVATVAATARATIKIKSLVDEAKDIYKQIDEHPVTDEYNEADKKSDRRIVTVQTGLEIGKEIIIPAIAGVVSIGCFYKSYRILTTRNLTMIGAFTALSESFKQYRERVKELYGEDVETKIAHGLKEVTVTEDDGSGKKPKKTTVVYADGATSPYVRYFCSDNPEFADYKDNPENFHWWIQCVESTLNEIRKARRVDNIPGMVSFNEALDATGFKPDTDAGLVCGWTDSEIKFTTVPCKVKNRFGEWEDGYSIDFNVEGSIYKKQEKIKEKTNTGKPEMIAMRKAS